MNDNLDHLISRRSFLRRGACASLGLTGLASQLFNTRMVHAALSGGSFSDYRALVCIFLFGGNDNGNTLIPYENGPQNHDVYAALRGNLALPKSDLASTVIAPSNTSGRTFALHPSLTQTKALFDAGNAAVISNVGTLVEPTTKSQYTNRTVKLPAQLFAHDEQQDQWQISTANAIEKLGWGGRVADALQAAGANPAANVSMNISIAGSSVFLSGRDVTPYTVSPWGPEQLETDGLGSFGVQQDAIRQAYLDLMALQDNPAYAGRHLMKKAYTDIAQRAVASSDIVQGLLNKPTSVPNAPPGNYLADQLRMVARLIEHGQSDLGHQRQCFVVAVGGYDNHNGLVGDGVNPGPHANLLSQLDAGIGYFWNALGAIGMRDRVTTFTGSDFGRTFVSNGNGSDHAWAAHHVVFGGNQVNGGQLYGSFPNLTIDGPQDTGNGRYIPTTSVDEYSFELARWIGVPLSEMPMVLPNASRFMDINNPSEHLGFLS